jgi:hypothetical protein
MVDDDAYADSFDDRGRQRLDLAAEDLDLGLARAHDVGLDLLAGSRGRGDAARDVEQLAHVFTLSLRAASPPGR